MKNLLSDILSTIQFKSAVYFKHGFCSPWGMDVPEGDFSQFHLVTGGQCLLIIDGESIRLEKGDIVILLNGHPHQIKDQHASVCRPGKEVVMEAMNEVLPSESQKVSTHLICGHYEMNREISHPIFEKLPDTLLIKSDQYGRYDLIHSIFELLTEEMNAKLPGFETVSLKLAEVLFVSIIRLLFATIERKTQFI